MDLEVKILTFLALQTLDYQEGVMKNRLRSALACFILSFFAYFRYLLAVSAILFIGSIFFRPLLYAGILALVLDVIFSIGVTVQVTMVGPVFKQDFIFQKDP